MGGELLRPEERNGNKLISASFCAKLALGVGGKELRHWAEYLICPLLCGVRMGFAAGCGFRLVHGAGALEGSGLFLGETSWCCQVAWTKFPFMEPCQWQQGCSQDGEGGAGVGRGCLCPHLDYAHGKCLELGDL